MFNPDKYRSVTWLKGGRVYPQLDCFGIVNEIRRDLNLPVWPDFAGVTKDDGGLDREARRMMLTLERCEPCEGAGVACYSGSTVTQAFVTFRSCTLAMPFSLRYNLSLTVTFKMGRLCGIHYAGKSSTPRLFYGGGDGRMRDWLSPRGMAGGA